MRAFTHVQKNNKSNSNNNNDMRDENRNICPRTLSNGAQNHDIKAAVGK